MPVTKLRKVGGSVMLAVPPALLERLHLAPGASVDLTADDGRLIVQPKPRPRYRLADLLVDSVDTTAGISHDRDVVDGPAVGRELL